MFDRYPSTHATHTWEFVKIFHRSVLISSPKQEDNGSFPSCGGGNALLAPTTRSAFFMA